ncbi:MAG: hypothetical protein HY040_18465 [Planctomycetes bacterium]|nr:hypothetical protein [Planctomycetota bacterium]
MGFLSGRVTCTRYKVGGKGPRSFDQDHLEQLASHAIGKQKLAAADGSQTGWGAGDHILDTRFELAKNIINDGCHFALRVDQLAIPPDLLRAYTLIELEGLAAANPSGLPSQRQKREARMSARERLENEARDGRYLKRKAFPILWDAPSGELLVGTTSPTAIDRLYTLFQQTFRRNLEAVSAGRLAFRLAELHGHPRNVDDASPTVFVASQSKSIAWTPDEADRDFLGNEFLLWLWYFLESESDTLKLADGSEATLMLARTLTLECPRGQTGKEQISSEGPTKLPEAKRAIQAGKLPRKVGLTLVRHDAQYELTLQAESLVVTGARLPVAEGEEERARQDERINQIRHLLETLDLIYAAFGQRRWGGEWNKETAKIKKWLQS